IIIEDARVTILDHMHPQRQPLRFWEVNVTLAAEKPTESLDLAGMPAGDSRRFALQGVLGGPHLRSAKFEAEFNSSQQTVQVSGAVEELNVTQELLSWLSPVAGPHLEGVAFQGYLDGEFDFHHRLASGTPPSIA